MTKQLVLLVICVTLINTVVFSVVSGCGIFQSIPLILGWHIVDKFRGSFFADNHAHVVAAVGALISACFLAGLMTLLAVAARRMGLLVSQSSVARVLAIGAVIYLILGLLPFPIGPCF